MIRFVFRWAFRLLLLAVVLVIGLLLLKDNLARSVAEQRIRQETGLETKIGKMELGLFTPTVRLENLVLYNTAEFGGGPLFDVPELNLEYEPKELALQRIKLKLLRLRIREMHIIENDQGRTNLVEVLHKVSPESLGGGRSKTEKAALTGVDMLNLSVGKVRYTNMRRPKRNQEVHLNMENELIQNLRTEQDLAAVLFKVLLRSGITIYYDPPRAQVTTSR